MTFDIDRRTMLKLAGATALAGGISIGSAGTVAAAGGTEIEAEGPMTAVTLGGPAGMQGTITVMGLTIHIPDGIPIHTPTATGLTLAQVGAGPAFMGRPDSGFMGGTAIVLGTCELVNSELQATAADLFVEPAENVLFGEVTENIGGVGGANETFEILGVPIRRCGQAPTGAEDARMPFTATSAGFDITDVTDTIPTGTLAVAEGYFGTDGILYAHTLEADQADIPNPGSGLARPSISRVRCDQRLEIRGAVSPDASGNFPQIVNVFTNATATTDPNAAGWTQIGLTDVEIDPETGLGEFRFRRATLNCPAAVMITVTGAPLDEAATALV